MNIMRIKPTAEAGQVLVQLDRKDDALLEQAAALSRGPAAAVRLKTILVPVDFSHCTREALDFAVLLARQFGASLAVLNVITPYYAVDPYGMNPPGDFEPDLLSCADKQLHHLVRSTLPPEVPAQTLVRHTNATVTPQTAVLSPEGKVLYLGPVDNRVEDFGKQRPRATESYVREVLDAVLSGKAIGVASHKSIGCAIPRSAK